MVGILLQKDPLAARWLPVASHCRIWKPKETLNSELALECLCIQESLAKLAHFTAYAQDLEVCTSPSFRSLAALAPKGHPKTNAQLLDIRTFNPRFIPNIASHLPPELAWDVSNSWDFEPFAEELPLPADVDLQTPARRSKYAQFQPGSYVHIQFDGGSKGTGEANPGECGAGFMMSEVHGVKILCNGIYMGNGIINN